MSGEVLERLDAFDIARTEQGMRQIGARLVRVRDPVSLRLRSPSQSCDLGKDVPHPVRALFAAADLVERAAVNLLLRGDEALEPIDPAHSPPAPSQNGRPHARE